MNNIEETDRKYQVLRRIGEVKNLRNQEKTAKGICLYDTKKQFSPKKYGYLEWTEGRGDNSKECTSTEGNTRQKQMKWTEGRGDNSKECTSTEGKTGRKKDTQRGPHECNSGLTYYNYVN